MSDRKLMLDTNVLARLCHPTDYREVQRWFISLLELGDDAPELLVSVLADYELRRTLIGLEARASLDQLDKLEQTLRSVPVTVETTRRAAELRAVLANQGVNLPDADLLMAAQADLEDAILVTGDVALHRVPGLRAMDWSQIDAATSALAT